MSYKLNKNDFWPMEDIKYKINTFKASLFNFFSSFLALILAYKWLFKLQCFESMLRSEDKNQMGKKIVNKRCPLLYSYRFG